MEEEHHLPADSNNELDDKAQAFMRLVFENDRRIYSYIYVFVPNRADVDDLFQDTLSVMWKKFGEFRPGGDFGAWGIGIAYNLVRNYRKKKGNVRCYLEEDIERLLEKEVRQSTRNIDYRVEALRKCLSRLNQVDRKIIQLRYLEDIPVRKIADMIGGTVKVVYTRLSRASDLLLRCIRRTLSEEWM